MKIPQHNEFSFLLSDDQQLVNFSSAFDSGNCSDVRRISDSEFSIDTYPDFDYEKQKDGYAKSWFHFRVQGFKSRVTFHIFRVKMLYNLWQSGNTASYRPIYRVGDSGTPTRLDSSAALEYINRDNTLRLTFSFDFSTTHVDEPVYFSFSYPYSYQKNLDYLVSLERRCAQDPSIYFHKEVLTYTSQMRPVHLLTISSNDRKTTEQESMLTDVLFPERATCPRAVKFSSSKPVVLISARVHPGETPSSFALEGLIDFLTNKDDLRAFLLRKYFTFMIIPMLNPDGVYAGHFRMDLMNQNLNRYYQIATHARQPAIFAAKRLITHLSMENRLFFYMDLHAHCGRKGTFLYGNALEDFALQVETQVFAKVMAVNDPTFEYEFANFAKQQMRSKDKLDELTKEGCGRVFVYQVSKIVHSYTLECGFHHMASSTSNNMKNVRPVCSNSSFTPSVKSRVYSLVESDELKSIPQPTTQGTSLSSTIETTQPLQDESESTVGNTERSILIAQKTSDSKNQEIDNVSLKTIEQESNAKMQDSVRQEGKQLTSNDSEIEFLGESSFRESGRAVLISLLDVYEKNPYSRIPSTPLQTIDNIRKQMAVDHARAIRVLPVEESVYACMPPRKVKNILQILNDTHFRRIEEMRIFRVSEKISWPISIFHEMTVKYTGKSLPALQNEINKGNSISPQKKRSISKKTQPTIDIKSTLLPPATSHLSSIKSETINYEGTPLIEDYQQIYISRQNMNTLNSENDNTSISLRNGEGVNRLPSTFAVSLGGVPTKLQFYPLHQVKLVQLNSTITEEGFSQQQSVREKVNNRLISRKALANYVNDHLIEVNNADNSAEETSPRTLLNGKGQFPSRSVKKIRQVSNSPKRQPRRTNHSSIAHTRTDESTIDKSEDIFLNQKPGNQATYRQSPTDKSAIQQYMLFTPEFIQAEKANVRPYLPTSQRRKGHSMRVGGIGSEVETNSLPFSTEIIGKSSVKEKQQVVRTLRRNEGDLLAEHRLQLLQADSNLRTLQNARKHREEVMAKYQPKNMITIDVDLRSRIQNSNPFESSRDATRDVSPGRLQKQKQRMTKSTLSNTREHNSLISRQNMKETSVEEQNRSKVSSVDQKYGPPHEMRVYDQNKLRRNSISIDDQELFYSRSPSKGRKLAGTNIVVLDGLNQQQQPQTQQQPKTFRLPNLLPKVQLYER